MNRHATAVAVCSSALLMVAACGGSDSPPDGPIVAQPRPSPDQQLSHELGAAYNVHGAVVDHHQEGADLDALTGASSALLRTSAPWLSSLKP